MLGFLTATGRNPPIVQTSENQDTESLLGLRFASSVPLSPVNGREKQIVGLDGLRRRCVGRFPRPFTGEGGRQAGRGHSVP